MWKSLGQYQPYNVNTKRYLFCLNEKLQMVIYGGNNMLNKRTGIISKCRQNTPRKTIFSFSRRPEKMVFPKKLRWNMIFLVLLGKTIFPFPENMILHLIRKMKVDLSLKIHGNMIFSSNLLKRWAFRKGPRRHIIFLALSGKMVFLSRKHDLFSLGRK